MKNISIIIIAFIIMSVYMMSCSRKTPTTSEPEPTPTPIAVNIWTQVLTNVSQVAAGIDHSLALKNDGTLWVTGGNFWGQLGKGDNTDLNIWTQVLTGVSKIAAGHNHSFALKSDGSLWGTGCNGAGHLGTGDEIDVNTWTQILTSGSNISEMCAGEAHSMALKTDGTLWVTGDNFYGELGNGTDGLFADLDTWTQVLTGTSKIAAHTVQSLTIKTDGTLWAAGWNNYGQLGNGGSGLDAIENTWTQVLTEVTSADTGYSHSLAVKTNGSLWATGRNDFGQLGTNNNLDLHIWTQVLTGGNTAYCGANQSFVMKSDNSLWATGRNDFGQLGTGNYNNVNTWIQVFTDASKVAGGSAHSLVIKSDGTLWVTGRNEHGQLGL